MNSKERVLSAANHSVPDRIPCGFHSTPLVTQRLNRHFGMTEYRDLLERIGSDIVDIRGIVDPVWIADFPQTETLPNGVTQNYLGFQMKEIQTPYGALNEHCGFILAHAQDVSELETFRWPQADWFDFSTMAQRLREYCEFAIMLTGPSVFQHPALVRGLDNLLCDMAAAPEIAAFIMDRYTDYYIDYLDRMFGALPAGVIDIVRVADDLGMQDRTIMSADMVKKFIVPRVKKIADITHSYGALLMMHSCGKVDDFIDDLIAAGVDILDPVQPLAAGMELSGLKRRFGERICFHGSVDSQYTLPCGTEEDIMREVRSRMELFRGEGGFIIAPAHSLQPDTSVKNIIAMYSAIRKYNTL